MSRIQGEAGSISQEISPKVASRNKPRQEARRLGRRQSKQQIRLRSKEIKQSAELVSTNKRDQQPACTIVFPLSKHFLFWVRDLCTESGVSRCPAGLLSDREWAEG